MSEIQQMMYKVVFWLINGELFVLPFDGSYPEGIAKSGDTYNHKKLWKYIKPNTICHKNKYCKTGLYFAQTIKNHTCLYTCPVMIPPLSWRRSIYIFECSGKMQLISISDRTAYISDRELRKLQKLCCLCHAIA